MRKFLSIALIAVSASTSAAQVEQPRTPEIVTGGRGEVRVAPNKAILVIVIETRAPTASESAAQAARIVASAVGALKTAGAKEDLITNGGYSVNQDYDNNGRRSRGFMARNSIRVEVLEVSNVGKFIDAALAAGATGVSPIQFTGPNMANARRDALKLAVEQARLDAESLASAAGGTLGRLLSVTTGIAQPMYGQEVVIASALSSASASPPTVIAPNDLVVAAVVNTRWEFNRR